MEINFPLRLIIVTQIFLYPVCSQIFAKEVERPMKFRTSHRVSQQVIQQYCQGSLFKVKVLRNAKGLIGGYVLQPSIMDSPIPYLDCNGDLLTSFHIFGSESEKENATKIIDPLRKEFPIEEPLDCSNYLGVPKNTGNND